VAGKRSVQVRAAAWTNFSFAYFRLVVEQQPKRARMCGFGDKDRRPITPPPCVRLIVTDLSGKEVDVKYVFVTSFRRLDKRAGKLTGFAHQLHRPWNVCPQCRSMERRRLARSKPRSTLKRNTFHFLHDAGVVWKPHIINPCICQYSPVSPRLVLPAFGYECIRATHHVSIWHPPGVRSGSIPLWPGSATRISSV